nr:complement decay-accelerating factor-like isoform X7 [Odocoileus virginianus texanus]
MIQEKQDSYAYGQSVTYKCMEGFALHGESSINCTVEDDQGVWSGPLPQCRAAKSTAVPRTSPRFHKTGTPKGRGSAPSVASIIASGCVPVTVIICIIILIKISRDSGKSGSYSPCEDKTHRCDSL